MKVLEDVVIPRNTGKSFIVKKRQRMRIWAESIVDFACFNLHNLRERFDQSRTKTNQRKIYISTGDALYSKLNNIMMTIVEDTYQGKHDMQFGTCSTSSYDEWWRVHNEIGLFKKDFEEMGAKSRADLPDHGCWENFQQGLEGYGIAREDLPSPFNIFQGVEVDPDGKLLRMVDKYRPEPGNPDHIDLVAELDLLTVVSACPEASKKGKEVRVQIFED